MWKNIAVFLTSIFMGGTFNKVKACIPLIVAQAELVMADGKITADERKDFAIKVINEVSDKFGLKMNSIARWLINVLIDKIAAKLPSKDIQIPDLILKITKEW